MPTPTALEGLVPDEPAPEAPAAPPSRPPLRERLVHRRVPQIMGIYLGAATSAVLFTDFVVGRYGLSPYLTDVLLAALVLSVPAVAVLAYAHGAPGPQRWSRRQVGALAANGVLGAAVVGVAFWGKPLGATTRTVVVEDEDGERVERVVANAGFRKRVVVSDFAGDEALGRAAGYALASDLDQDLFVTARGAGALRRPLREAGFETAGAAPSALLREAARRWQADRLLTGRVDRTDRGFRLEAELRTVDGPDRSERYTVEGPDLARLVDDVTARVRADLGLPETHVDTADDRLVEDVLTGSVEALTSWAAGRHALDFEDDLDGALEAFARALGTDSTFADAHLRTGSTLLQFAREDDARRAFAAAQRHRYRLTEPDRFALEAVIAFYDQRPDDALATVREWAALHPDDTDALDFLLSLQVVRDDLDGAVATAERLVEADPANPVRLYRLAQRHRDNEAFDDALEAAQAYAAAVPDDADGQTMVASILSRRGDADGAVRAARNAMRLTPTDLRTRSTLAYYLGTAGEWAEAERLYRDVARRAEEPSDRSEALNLLAHLLDLRGRYREAAETLDRRFELDAERYTPAQALVSRVGEGYHYVRAGRTEDFERALLEATANEEVQASGTFRAAVSAATAWAYVQTGRTAEVFRYAATADSLWAAYGQDKARPYARALRGLAHFNRGDWGRAAADLAPYARAEPADHFRVLPLAEAQARAGDRRAARSTAETVLRAYPSHPHAHLLLAKLASEPAERRRHLEVALDAWSGADVGFRPAAEARALMARTGA